MLNLMRTHLSNSSQIGFTPGNPRLSSDKPSITVTKLTSKRIHHSTVALRPYHNSPPAFFDTFLHSRCQVLRTPKKVLASLLAQPPRHLRVNEPGLDAHDVYSAGRCEEAKRGGERIDEGFDGCVGNHVRGADDPGERANHALSGTHNSDGMKEDGAEYGTYNFTVPAVFHQIGHSNEALYRRMGERLPDSSRPNPGCCSKAHRPRIYA